MRKIVIEVGKNNKLLDAEPKGAIELASMMQKVELFRVIYFLRQTPEEFAIITQVRFLEKKNGIEDLPFLHYPWISIQVLDFNSSSGTYTIFIRGNPPRNSNKSEKMDINQDIFPLSIEVINDKYLLTFLSNSKDIDKFIETKKAEGFGLRILSATKATLPIESPLDSLTNRQLLVLKEAYYSGYYNIPRKINSDQMAKKLGISNSTFVTSIRRAEKRIMTELFKGR